MCNTAFTYQIQYINIEVGNTDVSLIMNSVKKSKKRAQKREYRATVFGTPEHENIKAQQRERKREKYTNLYGTSEHENMNGEKSTQIYLELLSMKI